MDKKMKTMLALVLAVILAAMSTSSFLIYAASEDAELGLEAATERTAQIKASDIYTNTDYTIDWKSTAYKSITLSGTEIEAKAAGVAVAGNKVTVTASGVYVISGVLSDGSITVNVDKKKDTGVIYLVLNNVEITGKSSAPIWIMEGKKVVLLLADGTDNIINGGDAVQLDTDGNPSAAVFSKADLTIAGSGKLTVNADFNDGITSKDDLKITSGTIIVNAVSDGLVGKDGVSIAGGTLTINAGKDGIRATNDEDDGKGNVIIHGGTITIFAKGDGIQAYSLLQIEGGEFTVSSGGGYPGRSTTSGNEAFGKFPQPFGTYQIAAVSADKDSAKGLKAEKKIVINDGKIGLSSYDDSIHSNYDIEINGGTIMAQTGDDGIHAEYNLTINGGDILIKNSYEGLEAPFITINDGKITVISDDDGYNINMNNGRLTINGGILKITAGGDGIDSNGSIVMTGGTVFVDGPTANNNASLDYQASFNISGGTLLASGSSGMAQAPSSASTQASILLFYTSIQAAGTAITLNDAVGNKVVEFAPTKQYSSVVISSPLLKVGSSYALHSAGKELLKFTLASSTTYMSETGQTMQPMGPGGKAGGQMVPSGGIKRP